MRPPPEAILGETVTPDTERAEEERALLAEESLEETATLPADLGASGYDVLSTDAGHRVHTVTHKGHSRERIQKPSND